MAAVQKCLLIAIVLCYVLATAFCKERWVSISKRELKQLRGRAAMDPPPGQDNEGLGQARACNAQTCAGCGASVCFSNTKLQNQIVL